LKQHSKLSSWLVLNGVNIVYCECQESNMIHIGFLSHVRPILWHKDLWLQIKRTAEWKSKPFYFHLYHSTMACNRKGKLAPMLMIDVDQTNITPGINLFGGYYNGDQESSPCSIPYLFFSLHQNQLTGSEHLNVINNSLLHSRQVSIIHLQGLKDVDATIQLK
jgi:hypothetical protein